MELDAFSRAKRFVHVADTRVAYIDQGEGTPLLLLHRCPFSSFVGRKVIPSPAGHHRCLAPDLLGLGDTETPPGADWSLPAQEEMILGLLDALGVERTSVVGHDHRGAVAQLLAARHPGRLGRLVLCNAEAYDNWPSADERPVIALTQTPVLGGLVMRALATRTALRLALKAGGGRSGLALCGILCPCRKERPSAKIAGLPGRSQMATGRQFSVLRSMPGHGRTSWPHIMGERFRAGALSRTRPTIARAEPRPTSGQRPGPRPAAVGHRQAPAAPERAAPGRAAGDRVPHPRVPDPHQPQAVLDVDDHGIPQG